MFRHLWTQGKRWLQITAIKLGLIFRNRSRRHHRPKLAKTRNAKPTRLLPGLLALEARVTPAIDLSSNLTTGWIPITPLNGQHDALTDQQTASGLSVSQDIVGDGTYRAAYLKYADNGTSSDPSDDYIAFRIRVNNCNVGTSFTPFVFAGADVTGDGAIDFFMGAYNPGGGAGYLGVYDASGAGNTGPSDTGIAGSTSVKYNSSTTGYTSLWNFQSVGDGSKFSSDTDYFISFQFSIANINSKKATFGLTNDLGPNSPVRFIIGTAAQDNAFNQDISGYNGDGYLKSSLSWANLGVLSPSISLSGASLNSPPTTSNTSLASSINQTTTLTTAKFPFSDSDAGDTFQSVRILSLPTLGTLYLNSVAVAAGDIVSVADITAGNLTYQSGSTSGSASFTFNVIDSQYNESTSAGTVSITISANQPPSLQSKTVTYTDTTAVDTFANSTGSLTASDHENNTLTFGITGQTPSAGSVSKTGTYGTLTINTSTGAYTFAPNDYNALSANASENYSITVSDGTSTTTSTFTVNITAVNDRPTLTSVTTFTGGTEDTAYEITFAQLTANANEADPENNTISFRIDAVSTGTLAKWNGSSWAAVTAGSTMIATGDKVRWTPVSSANGTLNAFTVSAYDGALYSASPTQVAVAIAAVNDAPTLSAISTLTGAFEDTAYEITYAALLTASNAADVDGDTLSFKIDAVVTGMAETWNGSSWSPVVYGTLIAPGGKVRWTPAQDANGTIIAFTVKAFDGVLDSASAAQVKVAVAPVNDAPVIYTGTSDTIRFVTGNSNPTIRFAIPASGVVVGDRVRVSYFGQSQTSPPLTSTDISNGYIDVQLGSSLTLKDTTSDLNSVPVKWIDWTSSTSTTATGTLTTETGSIKATLTSTSNLMNVQTNGGGNYYIPATPFVSPGVAAPTTPDIVQFGLKGDRTLTFSSEVQNLYYAFVSMNGNGYRFDRDFDILSQAISSPGYWGKGEAQKIIQVDPVTGATYYNLQCISGEPHGVIRFKGAFTSVSWTNPTTEYWHGFTVGIKTGTSDLQSVTGQFINPSNTVIANLPGLVVQYDATQSGRTGVLDATARSISILETDAPLSTNGSISMYDIEATDLVTARVDSVAVSGATNKLTLSNAAIKSFLSASTTDTTALQFAKINWTFNSGTENFNWLAVGEEITFSYTVTADDGNGGTTSTIVDITIVGTDDKPTLTTIGTFTGGTQNNPFEITFADLIAAANEADIDNDPWFRIEAVSTGSLDKYDANSSTWVPVTAGTTQIALGDKVRFTPATNAHGTINAFTVKAFDGYLASSTAVQVKVVLAAVNNPPTLSSVTTFTGGTEDTSYEISYAQLIANANEADPENDPISFRIDAVSTGTLAKWNGSAWAAVTAGATMVATGDKIRWIPASNANGTLNAFTISAYDGALYSASPTQVSVVVMPVNDKPVVTAGATLGYTENAASAVIDNTITITDPDDTQLSGATISISAGLLAGDILGFTNQNGISGSYSNGLLTLSGTATLAQYQAALRSVKYSSNSDNPTVTSATRTVAWTVTDANSNNLGAQTSAVVTSTVNITAVNDPPTVTGTEVQQFDAETTVYPFRQVTVADLDNSSVSVTITPATTANGVLSVPSGTAGGINNGVYTLTGSPAAITTALRALTFSANANAKAAGIATTGFTINATDGTGAATDGVTKVISLNSAPVATIPANQVVTALQAEIKVQYTDNTLVNWSSIGTGDITASIAGTPLTITGVTTSPNSNSQGLTATYSLDTPAGGWSKLIGKKITVGLKAGEVTDEFGVAAIPVYGRVQILDAAKPVISTPKPLVSDPFVPITITFSQAITGLVASDIVVLCNGQPQPGLITSLTQVSPGTMFTFNLPTNPNVVESWSISIPARAATTTASGMDTDASNILEITSDRVAPTAMLEPWSTSFSQGNFNQANPVRQFTDGGNTNLNGLTYLINFSDPVKNLERNAIMVTDPSGTVVTGRISSLINIPGTDFTRWRLDIAPTIGSVETPVFVKVLSGMYRDEAGNQGGDSNTVSAMVLRDMAIKASLAVTSGGTSQGSTFGGSVSSIPLTLTLTRAVDATTVTAGAFRVTNATIGAITPASGTSSTYFITLNVANSVSGDIKAQFLGAGVRDAYGNGALATSELAWKRDVTGPSMLPSSRPLSARLSQQVSVAVKFSEALVWPQNQLDPSIFEVVNASGNAIANAQITLTGSGSSYTVKFYATERGTLRLRLKSGIANPPADLFGNTLLANGAVVTVNVT